MFQGEKVLIAMSLVLLKLSASECATVIMIHILTTGIPFHLCVCVFGVGSTYANLVLILSNLNFFLSFPLVIQGIFFA